MVNSLSSIEIEDTLLLDKSIQIKGSWLVRIFFLEWRLHGLANASFFHRENMLSIFSKMLDILVQRQLPFLGTKFIFS